jgi:hypothetical protein
VAAGRAVADPDLSPFAAPAVGAPAPGVAWREVLAFAATRAFVLVVGPAMFSLVPALLGVASTRNAAVAAAIGVAAWAPTSAVLFRLLFFPAAPDPGLTDAGGRPVALRDLRVGLVTRAVEHVLGTAPLLLLVPYAWRAFEGAPAVVASVAVTGWVLWRESVHAGRVLVEDAELLLQGDAPSEALKRVSFACRWLPRTGDPGAVVLARARFRTGDARGAVEALDAVRDRRSTRAGLLRAQMGVAFLPRAEVESAVAEADADEELALAAAVLRALVVLHDGGRLPPDVRAALDGACAAQPGLPCLLAAADVARTDVATARRLLEGWTEREWGPLLAAWPGVAAALGPALAG